MITKTDSFKLGMRAAYAVLGYKFTMAMFKEIRAFGKGIWNVTLEWAKNNVEKEKKDLAEAEESAEGLATAE